MGARNHVLDGVHIPPWEWAILRGKGQPIVKYRDTAVIRAKWLNQSRCHLSCELNEPKESCIIWGLDPLMGRAILRQVPIVKVYGVSAMSCAKTAEPMEMPFAMLSPVDPRNHVLDRVYRSPVEMGNFEGKSMPNNILT